VHKERKNKFALSVGTLIHKAEKKNKIQASNFIIHLAKQREIAMNVLRGLNF
jgi:hypothetical protein